MPVQVPGFAVSVWPAWGVPEIVGGDVFFGANAATTIAVAFDTATPLPSALVAVTRTRIVKPTSALRSRWLFVVAPAIAAQFDPFPFPPFAGQRSHWKAKLVGLFDQVPVVAVSVSPWTAEPEIFGSAVFTGFACDRADPKVGTSNTTAIPTTVTDSKPSHKARLDRTLLNGAVITLLLTNRRWAPGTSVRRLLASLLPIPAYP